MPQVNFRVATLQADEIANTVIQIKRSQSTPTPGSLANGELAYSYTSNKLYIGQTNAAADSVSVEYIGGKLLVEKTANLESLLLGGTTSPITIGGLIFTTGGDAGDAENKVMFVKNSNRVEFVGGTEGQLMQIAANGTPTFGDLNGGTYS